MPRPSSLPPLDLSDAKLSVVSPAVIAERRRTRAGAERSKAQQTLDSLVQVAYEKWVAAGKPEDFSERPGGNIRIPESQILQVTRALHKAGAYLNLSVRLGNVINEDGYADVVFTVTDRKVKEADTTSEPGF